MNSSYIPKNDFDWEYYLAHNDDLRQAGINGLESSYKHWIMYGCYENRPVKFIKSGSVIKVKLKPGEKFLVNNVAITPSHAEAATNGNLAGLQPKIIDLGFKVAVLIHIFDMNIFPFFVSYINYLGTRYSYECFDIYINVVEENNAYRGDLKKATDEQIKKITNPNISYFMTKNRGGDIGGFLLLCNHIIETGIDYKYVLFAHSKTRPQWRKDLCHAIFNTQFEHLNKSTNIGLIGSRKWINTFDPAIQTEEYRRFRYHLVDLCEIYDVKCDRAWQFIAGTMFVSHIDIIKYIVNHRIGEVYHKLNTAETIDINWMTIVNDELHKDTRGTSNDFQYRIKFGKPLHPDYMIEHTYERVIGLICNHLGLKMVGQ